MTKLALIVLVLAACKSEEDYKKQKPPEPEEVAEAKPAPPPPPKKRTLTPEELGSCTLKLTGAMKKELGDLVDGKILNEISRKVLG